MSTVHTFYYMYLSKTFSNVKNAVKSALLFYYSKDKLVTFLKAFQSKKQEPPPKPKYEFTKNLFREIINYSSNNTQNAIYMTVCLRTASHYSLKQWKVLVFSFIRRKLKNMV